MFDWPGLAVAEGDALGAYADVASAQMLIVHDRWSGMSEDSPLATTYELRRDESRGLTGTVKHSSQGALRRARDVTLSRTATRRLLGLLAAAPIAAGPYEPRIDHTDDFPHIEIVVVFEPAGLAGPGMLLLTTTSQGKFHTPWSVSLGGSTATSPGDEIGRVLTALRRVGRAGDG